MTQDLVGSLAAAIANIDATSSRTVCCWSTCAASTSQRSCGISCIQLCAK